jgi:NAD dependent epimerase/dehydratase family enzyme
MSWVHRLDWVEIVRWIVQTPGVKGAVNATAPYPVTNRHLTRALGRAMRRPSLLPVPGFALKIVVGEFAQSLLTGQRVLPSCAQREGYHFRYPEIEIAFRGIFGE